MGSLDPVRSQPVGADLVLLEELLAGQAPPKRVAGVAFFSCRKLNEATKLAAMARARVWSFFMVAPNLARIALPVANSHGVNLLH